MLTTHKKGSEKKLLDLSGKLKDKEGYYCLHFRFCELLEHYKTDYQLKISVNIISDLLRDAEGDIIIAGDYDIFVICTNVTQAALKKLIFQLRYLYMDDPLAYGENGTENERFCRIFDLKTDWNDYFTAIRSKYSELDNERPPEKVKSSYPMQLTPERLVTVESELGKTNIAPAIRKQPVCVARPEGFKTMFNEIYINISGLSELLTTEVNFASNKYLFKYLTHILDRRVLEIIRKTPRNYLRSPVSLNLNVDTLLSENFVEFDKSLDQNTKKSIVIELQLSDIFANMQAFNAAKTAIQKQGYRICLDGMDILSFIQVDRAALGFDLAKIYWNADVKSDLDTGENKKLAEAIERCGKTRIILCRCDTLGAVYYGQSLGISLFQGRYLDSVIDPNSDVVN